jgi:hypothetical protein
MSKFITLFEISKELIIKHNQNSELFIVLNGCQINIEKLKELDIETVNLNVEELS